MTKINDLNHIRPAIKIMKDVGNYILKKQKQISKVKKSYKKGIEIVSKFDILTEIMIRRSFKQAYPDHKIWGEELGIDHGNIKKEKYIVIDPIDGTKNFLSNTPLFASQVACLENGEIRWGIINLPALNEIYYAHKGCGAYLNGKRIKPSMQDSLKLSIQCFGVGHNSDNFIKLPKLLKGHLAEPRQYGCAGLHYSFTASGKIDIYIAAEANFYDMSAGLIICKESGLSFCNIQGGEYNFGIEDTSIVIGNKMLINQYKSISTPLSNISKSNSL